MVYTLLAQIPSVDPGADGSDPVMWALSSLRWVILQFHSHNSAAGVGMILMFMVLAFKKFMERLIPAKFTPWTTMVIGTLGGVGTSLVSEKAGSTPIDIIDAIIHGGLIGMAAVGGYHLIGQHVEAWFKKKFGKDLLPPPAPPPPT